LTVSKIRRWLLTSELLSSLVHLSCTPLYSTPLFSRGSQPTLRTKDLALAAIGTGKQCGGNWHSDFHGKCWPVLWCLPSMLRSLYTVTYRFHIIRTQKGEGSVCPDGTNPSPSPSPRIGGGERCRPDPPAICPPFLPQGGTQRGRRPQDGARHRRRSLRLPSHSRRRRRDDLTPPSPASLPPSAFARPHHQRKPLSPPSLPQSTAMALIHG